MRSADASGGLPASNGTSSAHASFRDSRFSLLLRRHPLRKLVDTDLVVLPEQARPPRDCLQSLDFTLPSQPPSLELHRLHVQQLPIIDEIADARFPQRRHQLLGGAVEWELALHNGIAP